MPTFERQSARGADRIAFEPAALIMAGWTGRDRAAVDHHIAELARLGVPGPRRIPTFYRLDPALLAGPVPAILVLGEDTSGEVEVVLLAFADGLWVGLGSDHTDRAMEAHGVALAKQLCRKPMATGLWRFDEVIARWDEMILRAYIAENGERRLYMESALGVVRPPADLIRALAAELGETGEPALPVGTVMFCGAIGAIGGIRATRRFEMELEDPALTRTVRHAYDVLTLPIVV
jgi:hypothetical protein